MTTNYLPETVRFAGNSKANMTRTLSYRISLSRGAGRLTDVISEVCIRAVTALMGTTALLRLAGVFCLLTHTYPVTRTLGF